ncbi:hypothetical protein [Paucibacter soli]|uniref:hypothetical protein n=1 Tax=Paucibacter soli TaxID=3133433 RepID=UPI0030A75B3F
MTIQGFITKRKAALAFAALGIILVALAIATEPRMIVVYEIPKQQAAFDADQLNRLFRNAVVAIGVIVTVGGVLVAVLKSKK